MKIKLLLVLLCLSAHHVSDAQNKNKNESWETVTVYYKDKSTAQASLKMKNYYENKVPLKLNGTTTKVDIQEIDSVSGQGFSYHTRLAYRPRKSGKEKVLGAFLMPVLYQNGDLTIYHTLKSQYADASKSLQVSHNFYLSSGDDDRASFLVMTLSPTNQMPIGGTEQNYAHIARRYVESEFADTCPELGAVFETYVRENKGKDLFQGLLQVYQDSCK